MTKKPKTSTSSSASRRGRGTMFPPFAGSRAVVLGVMLSFASLSPVRTTRTTAAWALSSSSFGGSPISIVNPGAAAPRGASCLVMRKQKASDRRTARMQRGQADGDASSFTPPPLSCSPSSGTQILSSSPMTKNQWKHKKVELRAAGTGSGKDVAAGGRGRARKRSKLYNSLASYHTTFSELISEEYRMEEAEVIARIESSIADPFSLERSGHALFDVHPQRRGNLFNDEVYRLEKSPDATTTFFAAGSPTSQGGGRSPLPPNHRFSRNDVVVLTLQPRGTGDFLGTASLPTSGDATSAEARVLDVGPAYLDVAIPAGKFAAAFGPASNNRGEGGRGDPAMRARADRFFSDVPFKRMAAALGQLTSMPERGRGSGGDDRPGRLRMDGALREAILSTFAVGDDPASDGAADRGLGDLVRP